MVDISAFLTMSVLGFLFETHPKELFLFIGIAHILRVLLIKTCARGFITFVVISNHLILVSDMKLILNSLIKLIFHDIRMTSLNSVSESILCTKIIIRLC